MLPSPPSPSALRLYGMQERADHLDFDIRFEGARDVLAKPHRHEYFQIQVSLEGGSRQVIGGAVRPFTAGHLSFVLPYRVHVVPHPPGARYAIVNFAQRFLWPELDTSATLLEEVSITHHPDLAPFLLQEHLDFHFEPQCFATLLGWLEEMAVLNGERRFGALASIRGLLLQLLGLTCRRHGAALQELAARHNAHAPQRDALRSVMRFVRERLHDDITLNDAAAAASLSPNYLAQLLKKQTGRSFTELLTERRIEHAKLLLVNSKGLIRDVARQCGFEDEAYFTRRFRRVMGITPRQFRAAALGLAAEG